MSRFLPLLCLFLYACANEAFEYDEVADPNAAVSEVVAAIRKVRHPLGRVIVFNDGTNRQDGTTKADSERLFLEVVTGATRIVPSTGTYSFFIENRPNGGNRYAEARYADHLNIEFFGDVADLALFAELGWPPNEVARVRDIFLREQPTQGGF